MEKKLKLWDATMLVMGSMIGSGIFIVSSDMMRNLGSGYWLIAVWIITGIMTVAAAISYGELSAMFPKAGGQYTYMTEIFGRMTGFLYGWGLFTVIQTKPKIASVLEIIPGAKTCGHVEFCKITMCI